MLHIFSSIRYFWDLLFVTWSGLLKVPYMLGFSCILLYGRQRSLSVIVVAPYDLHQLMLCSQIYCVHLTLSMFRCMSSDWALNLHLLQSPCVYSGPSCLVVIHSEQPEQAGLEYIMWHNVCHFTFQKLRNLSSCCQYA